MTSRDRTRSVAILVATCRRPEGLEALARSLDVIDANSPDTEMTLVVVDNDAEQSAKSGVESLAQDLSIPIIYGHEARMGIPFARNKTLELASGLADDVIFMDDDEVAPPGWLDELYRVREEHGADIVTGAVVPEFLEPPPDWMVEGNFLQYTRHKTGAFLDRAYTNNTMVPWSLIESTGIRFDEKMAKTGGSDTHFFRRLHRGGATIVWADEAFVTEMVPSTRSDAGWILQRGFRIGNCTAYIERDLTSGAASFIKMTLGGLYRIAKGIVTWPLGLLRGKAARVHAVRQIYYGAGMITGWFGFRYQEYKTIHGQ